MWAETLDPEESIAEWEILLAACQIQIELPVGRLAPALIPECEVLIAERVKGRGLVSIRGFLGLNAIKWSTPPGRAFDAPVRYGVAIGAVGVAVLLRLALDRLIGQETQAYITIYFATALVAWWAGWRPALLTLVLGILSCLWVVVPPRDSFSPRGPQDIVELLICLLVSAVIVLLVTVYQLTLKQKWQSEMTREWLAQNNQQLEQAVQKRTAELQETIGELQLVSHALVHDLRAPLRAMAGYAALLEHECDPKTQPEAGELCKRIANSAERLDHLIQDSLSYTRSVQGELPVETIDLSILLPSIIELYPNLERYKAQIGIDGELPRVLGNEAGLTQCFANLLGNSVKFMEPGVQPQLKIWAESKGAYVRIWIEDNGIGIAKEYHERIFNLFEQVSLGFGGTGVGLAIVRKTVHRMDGSVGVESESGKGSRFWVDLRCEPAAMKT
jgi:signal transduction histidine kinase